MRSIIFRLITALTLVIIVNGRKECVQRKVGKEGTLCVCNMTYCDDLDPIKREASGIVTLFETNKHGDMFKETKLKFGNSNNGHTLTIDRSKKFQQILGFGGSFTDAAGINIASLPKSMGDNIMKDYFSDHGVEYTLARIPMAGCDFSTHPYSYDDVPGDVNLTHFSLTKEDDQYKIPYIQLAKTFSPHNVKLFASPWSSPAWMKNNSQFNHGGSLIGKPGGEYYQIWANYFVKFLDAYKSHGIDLWGITVENEPSVGFHTDYGFNCLGLTAEMERDFIKMNLGPTLEKHGYGANKLKMMINDDGRDTVMKFADAIFGDPETAKYVAGMAFHWYSGAPYEILDQCHNKYPNYFILNTESSDPWIKDNIGVWWTGEKYANDILHDLSHWTTGWVDWNMALAYDGGPNWAHLPSTSPILINATSHEYYKQNMYYVMGHFSKLLPIDSVRIQLSYDKIDNFIAVAFERPDKAIVLTALNQNDQDISLNIHDQNHGTISTKITGKSIQSYIWWN